MKIILEQGESPELEVVIRGNLSDPQIPQLVALLNRTGACPSCFFMPRSASISVEQRRLTISRRQEIMSMHTKEKTARGAPQAL